MVTQHFKASAVAQSSDHRTVSQWFCTPVQKLTALYIYPSMSQIHTLDCGKPLERQTGLCLGPLIRPSPSFKRMILTDLFEHNRHSLWICPIIVPFHHFTKFVTDDSAHIFQHKRLSFLVGSMPQPNPVSNPWFSPTLQKQQLKGNGHTLSICRTMEHLRPVSNAWLWPTFLKANGIHSAFEWRQTGTHIANG